MIDLPAGSISYVVDPVPRRRGHGTAVVTAVLAMPELVGIEMFAAGVASATSTTKCPAVVAAHNGAICVGPVVDSA